MILTKYHTHTRMHTHTHTKEWTRRYKKKKQKKSKLCSSRKFQFTNQYCYSWLKHQVFLCDWKAKWKERTLCCSNLLIAYRPWKSAFKILAFTWIWTMVQKKKKQKKNLNLIYFIDLFLCHKVLKMGHPVRIKLIRLVKFVNRTC